MSEKSYKKLLTWQLSRELRKKIYDTTKTFFKSEYRRVSQMNDAARSVKQNIQEGSQKTLGEYIHYLERNAKPSLEELSGDIDDCFEDKLVFEDKYKELINLCRRLDYLLMRQIQSLKNLRNEQNKK